MSAMNETAALRAAAILGDGSADTDALLAAVAASSRQAGRRVHGLLMRYDGPTDDCSAAMTLVDVATGDLYPVSQALGAGSSACRADPQGFARASQVLRAALQVPADLVLVNRFGKLEAEGGGLSAEMLSLMAAGIPLLTVVPSRFVQAWGEFTGGAAVLAPRLATIDAWLEGVSR